MAKAKKDNFYDNITFSYGFEGDDRIYYYGNEEDREAVIEILGKKVIKIQVDEGCVVA